MTEWTRGFYFGCVMTLWLMTLAGCMAHRQTGNDVWNSIACNADNCGKEP